jgi:hypothetical protein
MRADYMAPHPRGNFTLEYVEAIPSTFCMSVTHINSSILQQLTSKTGKA